MPYEAAYPPQEPTRADVEAWTGLTLLEFGAPWCGICQGAQPMVRSALEAHPGVRHLKVEDGRGKPLGRSFAVKLWPTFVLMRDGAVLGRWVRPHKPDELLATLGRADAEAARAG
jgi:thioredoxin 1